MGKFDHFNLIAPIYDRVISHINLDQLIHLLEIPPQARLLDVGGGTGRVSSLLLQEIDQIVVTDLSLGMLRQAQIKGALLPTNAPAEQLPFPNESFDRILMVDAFHHVCDQKGTVGELMRVLTPGGRIVIEEPNINTFSVKLIALAEKLKETKNEAINELIKLGISKSTINKSWDHANDDFFLRYSVEEIVWHTIAIASSNESEFPLVLLRPQTQRGSAEIFLYTKNEDHIFSLSTAILDQLGLTILDARIVTTTDQYVLNSFQVLEQSGDPITDLYREIHICSTLRKYLIQRKFIAQRNLHRLSRQARHFPIPTRISFHEDPQNKYTILELITTDRAGLLSQIGKAFRQQNIQLYSAKITTIGSRAEDMFYILDYQNKLIKDPEKRRLIHDEILANLNVTGNAQEIKVNKSTNRP